MQQPSLFSINLKKEKQSPAIASSFSLSTGGNQHGTTAISTGQQQVATNWTKKVEEQPYQRQLTKTETTTDNNVINMTVQ